MTPSDPALLETLADCLESGNTPFEALAKVASAGGAAADWAQRVRSSLRADVPIARSLRESNVVDEDELAILSSGADAAPAALRTIAARRRRGLARRRAVRWGLLGPFAFAALTIVLAPLPDVIGGGPYVEPVIRDLFVLVVLTLAIGAGIPALLRRPETRRGLLRLSTRVPGLRSLAMLHAEEELATALGTFADRGELRVTGLTALATLLAWSPLGAALRDAGRSPGGPEHLAMGGLDPLARQLSTETGLAIVGGVASQRLPERLAVRGDAIAQRLTARLRLATRIGAYSLVVLLSASSLVGVIERGIPGMLQLPGGATSPEQKELEDLLKELQK